MVAQRCITQQLSIFAFKKNYKDSNIRDTVTYLKEQDTACNTANTSHRPKNIHSLPP